MSEGMKRCPFCGEEILSIARKCKYCDTWLNDEQDEMTVNRQEVKSTGKDNEKNITLGYDITGLVFACLVLLISCGTIEDRSDPDFFYTCLGCVMFALFPLSIAIIGLFNKNKVLSYVTLGITSLSLLLSFLCLLISVLSKF